MMIRQLITLMALLPMTACAGLQSNEPPQDIYSLRPAASTEEIPTGPARIVEIAPISVPPGMDRNRIALYLNDGRKLDYFASSVWSSDLGDVVQNFTRRSLTSVLPYTVAITPDQSVEADFRLQVKINDFEPVYGSDLQQTPKLVTNAEFTLIALPQEHIVSSFTLSKEGVAQDNRLDSITGGLEMMLQDMEREAFVKLDPVIRGKSAK